MAVILIERRSLSLHVVSAIDRGEQLERIDVRPDDHLVDQVVSMALRYGQAPVYANPVDVGMALVDQLSERGLRVNGKPTWEKPVTDRDEINRDRAFKVYHHRGGRMTVVAAPPKGLRDLRFYEAFLIKNDESGWHCPDGATTMADGPFGRDGVWLYWTETDEGYSTDYACPASSVLAARSGGRKQVAL